MPTPGKDRPLNVLFIGNSFTARNDLPGLIARLAEARGRRLEHRLISAGGASLRMHWNKGAAGRVIAAGGDDLVVLQEQSTLPVKSPARMAEGVRLFDEAIRKSGAKTALYLTWARAHSPQNQQAITDAYTSIGKHLGALVVPVGIVWEQFLEQHRSPVLYDRDQSHPSMAGSFLAACVFYATLFDDAPAPIEVKGLSTDEVERIRTAARPG